MQLISFLFKNSLTFNHILLYCVYVKAEDTKKNFKIPRFFTLPDDTVLSGTSFWSRGVFIFAIIERRRKMKAIIMLGSFILAGTVMAFFFNKVSILTTYFNLQNSPIWCDVVFLLVCGVVVVQRGVAIYQKLF